MNEAALTTAGERVTGREPQRGGVGAACRFEAAKLLAQWPTRILPIVCVLAPLAFAAVLKIQSGVPADTLFGSWVHTSGFAIPLVILSFTGAWGLPLIAGIVGGDIVASEDRLDTWKATLTRSCTRTEIFIGKVAAACAYTGVMVVLLCASSLLAGILATGTQPLVGLSGQTIGSGQAAALTIASWSVALLPALGFTCLAVLISTLTRSSAAGMLGPLVVSLAMQLLSLVGSGDIVRALLLSTALDAWNGLFASPAYVRPIASGAAVSLGYVFVCLAVAWASLRDRDIAGPAPVERRFVRQLRVVAVAVAAVAVLAAASNLGPTGITAARLDRSIKKTFENLTVLQQEYLGRHVPAGAHLQIWPSCRRQGAANPTRGPGDNWLCALDVIQRGGSLLPVAYDVAVKPNGCYTAEGPPSYIGPLTIRERNGTRRVNPLFRFDGCFEVAP
jgi:ABC-2 type transport system permease protein